MQMYFWPATSPARMLSSQTFISIFFLRGQEPELWSRPLIATQVQGQLFHYILPGISALSHQTHLPRPSAGSVHGWRFLTRNILESWAIGILLAADKRYRSIFAWKELVYFLPTLFVWTVQEEAQFFPTIHQASRWSRSFCSCLKSRKILDFKQASCRTCSKY